MKVIEDYGDSSHFNYVIELTYDLVGNTKSMKDKNNNITIYNYKDFNRLEKITSPAPFNYITKFDYDENGDLEKTEKQTNDPLNPWQTTICTYTNMGKLETIKDDLNQVTSYEYNLINQKTIETDAEGNKIRYIYDERKLLKRTTDALNQETTRYYDPVENLIAIVDAKSQVTFYEYDKLNRLVTTTFQDGSKEILEYDYLGNITKKTTRRGDIISYEYDALN